MHIRTIIIALALSMFSLGANAFCFEKAGARYGIDQSFLKAIAKTESSLDPKARSSANAIGLMQIHESWFPTLRKRYGLTESDLWEPCTNVMVGAWILANEFAKRGKNWNAVGAYNAACTRLKGINCTRARQKYANAVWKNWNR